MRLALLPTLAKQRELYGLPRGMERFWTYIGTMTGGSGDIVLPIVAMNPMAKEHVLSTYEALAAFDAEAVVAGALDEAARRLPARSGDLRVALVVADAARGGWTHREHAEFTMRVRAAPMLKRGFVVVPVWTGETPTPESVRAETLAACARAAHEIAHGPARALRDVLAQEGAAARFADLAPRLPRVEIERARVVLETRLAARDEATLFAAMYGDRAATELGHAPLGLPERAGYDVALAYDW